MISREEPAKINNVDSVVSVNTCDKAKRKKKFISAKFSLDSGKEVSHNLWRCLLFHCSYPCGDRHDRH